MSTTDYSRGDVVLVNFVFTEGTGTRRRPVVLISSAAYQKGREEAIVVAVTSNTDRILLGDHLISDWRGAGLLYPSVATGIIRTIKQSMIFRKLGSVPAADLESISNMLRLSLGLA